MAGGKGSRMQSSLPKTLHHVGGIPIIDRLRATVREAFAVSPVVIVGHESATLRVHLGESTPTVTQEEQLGTGHAVRVALEQLPHVDEGTLLVIPGDHPLISVASLQMLVAESEKQNAPVLLGTVQVPHFEESYKSFAHAGRVVRDDAGMVQYVKEYKDADEGERAITELNVSMYCFDLAWLRAHINLIGNENKNNEYYLTDIIGIARNAGYGVFPIILPNIDDGRGVNTQEELQEVERILAERNK